MKTNTIILTLLSLMSLNFILAQDNTTVTANNSEISDNLDLRAVASIFGESKDLNDFENRLNNPEYQISNLDLNNDNKVDYLRVIETVDGNAHLIIIQSVLGKDLFQDIATVEVTKDRDSRIQVQVVGDVYMYGTNYIYEPVYVYTPIIYTSFWAPRYRPYYSSWYWGYYPSYYVAWHPFPIFRYRNNVHVWINFNNHYNYVNTRNCAVVYNNYYRGRRGNAYEAQHPNRSFNNRHDGYTNRYELDKTRNIRSVGTVGNRSEVASNNIQTTNNINTTRTNDNSNSTRNNGSRNEVTVREIHSNLIRSNNAIATTREETTVRNNTIRELAPTRSNATVTSQTSNSTKSKQSVRNEPTRSSTTTSVKNNSSATRNNEMRSNSGKRTTVSNEPTSNNGSRTSSTERNRR